MDYVWIMVKYSNVKIPTVRLDEVKERLREKGLESRGNAEAINHLISAFLLNENKEE